MPPRAFLPRCNDGANGAARPGPPAAAAGILDMTATHPSTAERVQVAATEARAFGAPGVGAVERDRYLQAIDNLAYGDDPEQGLVIGRQFLHAKLGFAFTAPDTFTLENQTVALIGVSADGAQALRLDSVSAESDVTPEASLTKGWIDGVDTTNVTAPEARRPGRRDGHRDGRSLELPLGRREARLAHVPSRVRGAHADPGDRQGVSAVAELLPSHRAGRSRRGGRRACPYRGGGARRNQPDFRRPHDGFERRPGGVFGAERAGPGRSRWSTASSINTPRHDVFRRLARPPRAGTGRREPQSWQIARLPHAHASRESRLTRGGSTRDAGASRICRGPHQPCAETIRAGEQSGAASHLHGTAVLSEAGCGAVGPRRAEGQKAAVERAGVQNRAGAISQRCACASRGRGYGCDCRGALTDEVPALRFHSRVARAAKPFRCPRQRRRH